ncbi:MAG: hypothetical protein WHX60_15690 [Armatimonadota bacterium]
MHKLGTGSAALLIAAIWSMLLLKAGYGDSLSKACQQRDAWSSHRTFVWDVAITVSVRLTPAERKMLESTPSTKGIPAQRQLEGRLVVMRTPSLTYMGHEQARATIAQQVGRYEYWFGQDFVVVAPYPLDSQNMPQPALVIPTPSDALYVGFFMPPLPDELALVLHPSFIAGANPLRVFAPASIFQWHKGAWNVSERRGNMVVLRLAGVPGVEAECWLDASRRFAPTLFKGRQGTFTLEYTASDWQMADGWWLPGRVSIHREGGAVSSDMVLTLRQVAKTPADLHIVLPRGQPITDLRDIPPESIAASGLMLVQGSTYHYTWSGSLPPKGTLPVAGMRTSQPFRMVGPPPQPASDHHLLKWLLSGAIIAAAVGALWYWRLKVKKTA